MTMTDNVLLVQDTFQGDAADGAFYKPTGFISHGTRQKKLEADQNL